MAYIALSCHCLYSHCAVSHVFAYVMLYIRPYSGVDLRMIVPYIQKFYSINVMTTDEQTAVDAVSDTSLCSNYDTIDNNNNSSSGNVLNESLTSSSTHGSTCQAVLVVTALWEALSQCIPRHVMQCVFTTTGIHHDSVLVQAWQTATSGSDYTSTNDSNASGIVEYKLYLVNPYLSQCFVYCNEFHTYYSKDAHHKYTHTNKDAHHKPLIVWLYCSTFNITDVKAACECIEEYDVQGNLLKDLFKAAIEDDSSVSSNVPVKELNVSDACTIAYSKHINLNALHRCIRLPTAIAVATRIL
jgi:hypothetical protein